MHPEVTWVLLSSRTQVHLQVILDPDYPPDYLSVSYDYGPIQVVISLPLWVKLTMGQLLLFFLCNFSSFFSYVARIPVTNHFSLLASYIDRHILAVQQFISHNEHL